MAQTDEPLVTFDGPSPVRYADVARHVWGDAVSGEVSDWTYVSSDKITQLLFGMSPGAAFYHSDEFKTVFAADEVYFVLSGTLVLANPATGEVVRAGPDQAVFFRRDTWHHGWNDSVEPLRVLEYFAPPPAQGTGAAYARRQANLERTRYAQDEWLSHWYGHAPAKRARTMAVISQGDGLLTLNGDERPGLERILVSTDQLTVGILELLPGQSSAPETHGGDESLFVLKGIPRVRVGSPDARQWWELVPRDGFFIPEGAAHQISNTAAQPAAILFGIAPHYILQS